MIKSIAPTYIDIFCLHRKFLIYNLVERNLKLRYRGSFLGMFWTILVPASMSVVYYFVFQFVMRVQMENYMLYLMAGTLPWAFYSGAIMNGMESIVSSAGLVQKVPIPPHSFPFAETITQLLNFMFSVPVLLGIVLLTGAPITSNYIYLPYLFFLLFIQAYGIALVMCIAFVYFRDLRHAMGVIMQIWFFGNPILYDMSMLPEKVRNIFWINPCGYIFKGITSILAHGTPLTTYELVVPTIWSVVLFLLGLYFYNANKNFVVENI